MFNLYITESALKNIVLSEGQKPQESRSYLYKIMRRLRVIGSSHCRGLSRIKEIDNQ